MSHPTDPHRELALQRVAWISSAYGYNGELVYFQDIFAEFHRRFPLGIIPVNREFPVDRYPGLPLVPMLGFHLLGRTSRSVGDVTYVGVRRIPTLATWWRLVRLRVDAHLLIEFSPTALVGFIVAKAGRRSTVLMIESDPSYRGAPAGRISRAIKRFVAQRVDVVLVSNEIGAAFVRDELCVSGDKMLVGPYLTSCPTGMQPSEPIGGRGDRVRLLFLNSIVARKGLTELIDALAALPFASRDRWVLDVVGDGSELQAIRQRVADVGLTANVVFHGRTPWNETGRYYANSDLVVCPTLADYRSLGGFEAVNAGKPVLVSRYDGAHAEILRYAAGARLIDPRDLPAFTMILEELILDDEAFAATRQAAAAVPERFSLRSVGQNVENAVDLAIRGALADS